MCRPVQLRPLSRANNELALNWSRVEFEKAPEKCAEKKTQTEVEQWLNSIISYTQFSERETLLGLRRLIDHLFARQRKLVRGCSFALCS